VVKPERTDTTLDLSQKARVVRKKRKRGASFIRSEEWLCQGLSWSVRFLGKFSAGVIPATSETIRTYR
jgi:hypothetical protein